MARKQRKVPVSLDSGNIKQLNEQDIRMILRAADELIDRGGRNLLVKILKGSKDKKILEYGLDDCPAYGYFHDLKKEDVEHRVDWMIRQDYLRITYDGRLPLLVFSERGWEIERETYARELFERLRGDVASGKPKLILEMENTNRQVIYRMLDLVRTHGNRQFIPQLEQFREGQVKKVRARINSIISDLQKQVRLAVLFPGIGYTCDRPLLYYTGKMLQRMGYKVIPVPYGNFPPDVKGDALKMRQCFFSAFDQAEDLLDPVDFDAYEDVIFIGKSVGTLVALQYAHEHKVDARFVLLTPVEQTFDRLPPLVADRAIAFHGTSDPWAETEVITSSCAACNIPLHVTADANHSLETGDVDTDIKNLQEVLGQIRQFAEIACKAFDDGEQMK